MRWFDIRSRLGVPAYVWNKGEEEKAKERERLRKLHEQYGDSTNAVRLPTRRINEECAVLVGGYKDQESAVRALRDVKNWPAPQNKALCPIIHKVAYQEETRLDQKPELEGSYVNPFVMAFVSHNPTINMEKKPDPKLEALMKKINAHEKYSVYGCRKPWTLVVAQFQGVSVIQTQAANESFIDKVFSTWKGESLSATGRPLNSTMTSPRSSPAFAEGPAAGTRARRAPLVFGSPNAAASCLVM